MDILNIIYFPWKWYLLAWFLFIVVGLVLQLVLLTVKDSMGRPRTHPVAGLFLAPVAVCSIVLFVDFWIMIIRAAVGAG